MINLVEILIGMFITVALMYTMHFYGVRAMLLLVGVFVVSAVLAVWFFTEILKTVCLQEEEEDIETGRKTVRYPSADTLKQLAAYYVLNRSVSAFEKVVKWCCETLDGYQEGGDLDD